MKSNATTTTLLLQYLKLLLAGTSPVDVATMTTVMQTAVTKYTTSTRYLLE